MPTYVYRREDGTTFEYEQGIKDSPLTVDPETGQKVTRIISGGASLIFKGTGFYLTDYARKHTSTEQGSNGASAKSSTSDADATPKASSSDPVAKGGGAVGPTDGARPDGSPKKD